MNQRNWDEELGAIAELIKSFPEPSVNEIESGRSDPWDVLISTIISLRTKDSVTLEASKRILREASDPDSLLRLGVEEIARLIYPAGFYRTKAANMVKIARILLDTHDGKVPPDKEALLALPGVGLKTANLVLSIGFGIPAICVDIHVHRIANRRGWIETANPDASERALRTVLPVHWWIDINRILVSFGQRICTPVSPHCSECAVSSGCPRRDVHRSR